VAAAACYPARAAQTDLTGLLIGCSSRQTMHRRCLLLLQPAPLQPLLQHVLARAAR
jgi:hypothetical protein